MNALADGIRHEKEHTESEDVASEIARDHLASDPLYYTKLSKMEANNATSDESETPDQDTDEDSEQERPAHEAAEQPARPSRSVGRPSRHSLNAIRDFAMAAYTAYYQDQDE